MNDVKTGDPRQVKADVARAYGPEVIGSKQHDAAVMLSFIDRDATEGTKSFADVFLDCEVAVAFHSELGRKLGIPSPAEVVKQCATAVDDLRCSEAGLFDPPHSGQRGEDRSNGIYDAYKTVAAVVPRCGS